MQHKDIVVQKASGEPELFSIEKLIGSLQNSGANQNEIEQVVKEMSNWLYDGISTRQIYSRAYELLQKEKNYLASRYKLKNAIMELGPTGYPFERFVAKIFEFMGFTAEAGIIMQGCCVTHEVDVVALRGKEEHLVECKYSQSQGKTVSVQVPLYVRSRIDDIVKKQKQSEYYEGFSFQGWVVTNTRFTTDAIDYGKCSGLNMLSWDYPLGNSMKDIIDRKRIYPVTVLTNVSAHQKQYLLEQGIVICRQLTDNPELLDPLHLDKKQFTLLMNELSEIT